MVKDWAVVFWEVITRGVLLKLIKAEDIRFQMYKTLI